MEMWIPIIVLALAILLYILIKSLPSLNCKPRVTLHLSRPLRRPTKKHKFVYAKSIWKKQDVNDYMARRPLFDITGPNPPVSEIVTAYLKAYGYDGLCADECGCFIEDLIPCGGEGIKNCKAGFKHPCDANCNYKEYGCYEHVTCEKEK